LANTTVVKLTGYDDIEGVSKVMSGADVVFAVTDYFSLFSDPLISAFEAEVFM
jgi:hypothetical protein